ncbi:MAG: HPr family phosphocarrier protein [Lachnospiraceae bacterium]
MVSKTVRINLVGDAEARPVAILVQKASQFDSKVYITSEEKKINAKSIMGMMSLGLSQNAEVTISAEGEDEQAAVTALAQYLENAE